MRTWIGGGMLALITSGGLFFVMWGLGNPSHCGPCLDAAVSASPLTLSTPASDCSQGACPSVTPSTHAVVELVDVAHELNTHPTTAPQRLVSFEEPPLAAPRSDGIPLMLRPESIPTVMQAGFIEPIRETERIEVAPHPRKVRQPGDLPLGSPNDPF